VSTSCLSELLSELVEKIHVGANQCQIMLVSNRLHKHKYAEWYNVTIALQQDEKLSELYLNM